MILGAATVNQTPLNWNENTENILNAIKDAQQKQVDILCLPELTICGYGCEDIFLSDWLWRETLEILLNKIIPACNNILVSIGLPLKFEDKLYNCVALVHNGKLEAFIPKQNLANDGVHYEPRWFTPWEPERRTTITIRDKKYKIGDYSYDLGKYKIGFEICEDAWRQDRPACRLEKRGVNLILNPSASHFALAKSMLRQDLIINSSKSFNCTYIYANLLGNESGRMIYDGELMIAKDGQLIKHNELLSFKSYNLITWDDQKIEAIDKRPTDRNKEFHKAGSLALFDYLRKSKSNGFVLSLSGGADSSTCAVLVSEMIKKGIEELGLEVFLTKINKPNWLKEAASNSNPNKYIAEKLFTTAYQGTVNSSSDTLNSAKQLANQIGAEFYNWIIDDEVNGYRNKIETVLDRKLSWDQDDIALQNIQARARSPIIWMLANIKNALLITTSNRSEGSVGYTTMDGDTSGSIAPIAAIDKPFIIQWLKWAEKELRYTSLKYVNSLQPTAELRPSDNNQTDETDLMPYPLLQAIENLAINKRLSPVQVYKKLIDEEYQMDKHALKAYIIKFYQMWSRNQWKRERLAPSFHLDDYNVDPKTWYRFPILSGAYQDEIKALENLD